jgi:hypothetical protein
MEQLFHKLIDDPLTLLTLVGGLVLGWIITSLVHHWRVVRLAEIDANLKRQMLDRGMTPADIEQVLRAANDHEAAASGAAYSGNEETDKARLVALLTEHGCGGKDISRVLRAFGDFRVENAADRPASLMARARAVESMIVAGNTVEEAEQMLHAFHGRTTAPRDDEFHVVARN